MPQTDPIKRRNNCKQTKKYQDRSLDSLRIQSVFFAVDLVSCFSCLKGYGVRNRWKKAAGDCVVIITAPPRNTTSMYMYWLFKTRSCSCICKLCLEIFKRLNGFCLETAFFCSKPKPVLSWRIILHWNSVQKDHVALQGKLKVFEKNIASRLKMNVCWKKTPGL